MVSPSNCIYLRYSLYIFINVSCGLTEILSMVLQNLVKSFILFRMMRTNVKYSNFLYAHLKYVENGHKDQCTYYVFLGDSMRRISYVIHFLRLAYLSWAIFLHAYIMKAEYSIGVRKRYYWLNVMRRNVNQNAI